MADAADVDLAVAAASGCCPVGRRLHADARASMLHRAADLIVERIATIADLLTREQGKPVPDAEKESRFGVEVIRLLRRRGAAPWRHNTASARTDVRSLVVSSPVGVSARSRPGTTRSISMPGNGSALAAGCSLIVKPPHETPLAVGMVAQCFADAGLPAGVLNDCRGRARKPAPR